MARVMSCFDWIHKPRRGAAVPTAKLTEAAVRDILARRLAGQQPITIWRAVRGIAAEPLISLGQVQSICRGAAWHYLYVEYFPDVD